MKDLLQSVQSLSSDRQLNACLSVYSAVLQRIEIPRIYLLSELTQEMWTHTIASLFFGEYIDTVRTIHQLGTSLQYINSLSDNTKQSLVVSLDDILYDKYGEGEVFYDMARFTPFTDEDIALKSSLGINQFTDFLNNRQIDKQIYQTKYRHLHNTLSCQTHMSTFDMALKNKIEISWQRRWKDIRHYRAHNADEMMVTQLYLAESL